MVEDKPVCSLCRRNMMTHWRPWEMLGVPRPFMDVDGGIRTCDECFEIIKRLHKKARL